MNFSIMDLVIDLTDKIDLTQEIIQKHVSVGRSDIIKRYQEIGSVKTTDDYLKMAESYLKIHNKGIKGYGLEMPTNIDDFFSVGITTDVAISQDIEEVVKSGEAPEPDMYSCTTGTTGISKRFPIDLLANSYAVEMGIFFLESGLELRDDMGFVVGYAPSPNPKFKHSSEVVTRSSIASLKPDKVLIVPYGQAANGLKDPDFREKFIQTLENGGGFALIPPDLPRVAAIAAKDEELKEVLSGVNIVSGGMHLEEPQRMYVESVIGEKSIPNIYGSTTGLTNYGEVRSPGMKLTPWRLSAILTEDGELIRSHEAEPGTKGFFCVNGPFPLHTYKDIVEITSNDPLPVISHNIGRAAQKMTKKLDLEGVRGESPWTGIGMFLGHNLPSGDMMRATLHKSGIDPSKAYGVLSVEDGVETATIFISPDDYAKMHSNGSNGISKLMTNGMSADPRMENFRDSVSSDLANLRVMPMGEKDDPRRQIMKLFWLGEDNFAEAHRLSEFTLEHILEKHPELAL